jgi:hypothetical protein
VAVAVSEEAGKVGSWLRGYPEATEGWAGALGVEGGWGETGDVAAGEGAESPVAESPVAGWLRGFPEVVGAWAGVV